MKKGHLRITTNNCFLLSIDYYSLCHNLGKIYKCDFYVYFCYRNCVNFSFSLAVSRVSDEEEEDYDYSPDEDELRKVNKVII